ncbi:MAG: DUF2029 domain-containing protein [Planctomycetes bacterium]|nr:DUF2029 domain-containing protein [Planctomycetota bacterium]
MSRLNESVAPDPSSPHRAAVSGGSLARTTLLIVAAACLLHYPFRAAKMYQEGRGMDFVRGVYFHAHVYASGADPFDPAVRGDWSRRLVLEPEYLPSYPPPFYLAIAPLARWLPVQAACGAWLLLEHLFLAAALLLWWRARPPGFGRVEMAAVLVLVACFDALTYDVRAGQSHMLMLFLLSAVACAWGAERPWTAGALLGLALLVKVQVAVVVGLLVLRGGLRVLAGVVCVVGVIAAASLALVPASAWMGYLGWLAEVLAGRATPDGAHLVLTGVQTNVGLSGWLHRLWVPSDFSSPVLPWAAAAPWVRASASLAVLAVACVVLRKPPLDREARLADVGLAVVATLLASPKVVFYDFVWLLLPVYVLCRDAASVRPALPRWVLPAGYLLCFQNSAWWRVGLGQWLGRPAWLSLLPPPEVIGGLLLFFALAAARRRPLSRSVVEAIGARYGRGECSPITGSYVARRRESLRASLPHGGRVLDLGCGGGAYLDGLGDGRRGLGVDLSLEALRAGHRHRGARQLICADAGRLPLADGSIDAVMAIGVLHHALAGIEAILSEVRRVLRPGGRLFIDEHNGYNPLCWLLTWVHPMDRDGARPIPPGRLGRLLRSQRFVVASRRYWGLRLDLPPLASLLAWLEPRVEAGVLRRACVRYSVEARVPSRRGGSGEGGAAEGRRPGRWARVGCQERPRPEDGC